MIDRPMSRNANAVSTKATYSHTVSIAWRVRSLTPACAASLPRTIPATTVAMTPDWPSALAIRYVP